ncbi:MAG TPA: serine hydrolase domain-containing protein [Sphingomicrobium sp.]|nr:serine hydrolase domain-containing protein [Sphingomicrobium sp.]
MRKFFTMLASFALAAALITPALADARPQTLPAKPAFPPAKSIQAMLDNRVANQPGVGIVLVTYKRGQRARIYTSGTTGKPGLPLDGQTIFEIGSITKTFTTALLAEMVNRGEVSLQDPVSKYLPPKVKVPERSGRKITLLDLATHTSGLPGLPTNIHPRDMSNPYADYTVDMVDEFLSSYSLPRDIGSKYEYSAVGMALLGRALGYRLGMSWEEAVTERILEPLDMRSTSATLTPDARGRLAPGHDENGKLTSNWDIPALPAMGALHSSANDMLKYLVANLSPGSKPLGLLLGEAHVPRVVMDEETRVGLAWQTGHATNRTITWHGGGTGGYRSLIAFDQAKGMGVIVLTNFAKGADDIGFHLLDATLPIQ